MNLSLSTSKGSGCLGLLGGAGPGDTVDRKLDSGGFAKNVDAEGADL